MSNGKASAAWDGLNERQRLYLSTIFRFDQAAEADIRRQKAEWLTTPPASEWRLVTYDIKLPRDLGGYSSVQHELREAGQHDSGSGSTLAALERRGLVEVEHDHIYIAVLGKHVPRVRVRLTAAGRAAARAGAGITGPATAPAGLMARWSFAALARLYEAGDNGLTTQTTWDEDDKAPPWKTLLHLRDRKDGSHIEEFSVHTRKEGINPLTGHEYTTRTEYRVRLSPAGVRHYELHHACYRELYPDVEAVEPRHKLDLAHADLAAHQARKPPHLVRVTDVPVLARLAVLEAAGNCYLRTTLIKAYEERGWPVPEDVRALPSGLTPWQVKKLTRTERSIDRLRGHRDGPLVDVLEVENLPQHRHTHPVLPLVVLTEHGRRHYAGHRDEYLRAYPDLTLPDTITERSVQA
ncbi:hypothetical protein C8D87_11410 [Lentzea atacamensis]|uniref:Replication-relaxation n=1 Tax=Lentzea atacamensis TaxID=531938 RepID=A0ABX9DXG0_9PSEU|nr:hypothetical protein [Lentzea atacamensis]RAS59398.1 hypothetical protein C8D87_11410 [Lentzea atacamensis]